MSHPNNCWNDEHVAVIFCYLWKKSKQQPNPHNRYTTVNCLFKAYINSSHIRYYADERGEVLPTQEDYASYLIVVENENSICNIIKEFSIPTDLPWHLVDEVYVPINCDGEFHWVLPIIVLKERHICGYDSMWDHSRHKDESVEVQKLVVILPYMLRVSGFFDQKDQTNWSSLDSYNGKNEQHPFDIKYVSGITQDCRVFVVDFAEYLSDGLQVPSSGIYVEFHRMRYASLLCNYGVIKARNGYVIDNEDSPRPKPNYIAPDEKDLITVE